MGIKYKAVEVKAMNKVQDSRGVSMGIKYKAVEV